MWCLSMINLKSYRSGSASKAPEGDNAPSINAFEIVSYLHGRMARGCLVSIGGCRPGAMNMCNNMTAPVAEHQWNADMLQEVAESTLR